MTSADTNVRADISVAETWASTLFETVENASKFFQSGAIGWSPTRDKRTLKGLKLETTQWRVHPGQAISVESSFFDTLPVGSAMLDSVLVMRNVPVTWSTPTEHRPSETSRMVVSG